MILLCSLLDKHCKEQDKRAGRDGGREHINEGWVKEYLLKYTQHFPPVSSHLEKNIDICLYGYGRFKAFHYKEMWGWYQQHKILRADPQAGTADERRKAKEAFDSVSQWLGMTEQSITSKSMKRFRRYILDKMQVIIMGWCWWFVVLFCFVLFCFVFICLFVFCACVCVLNCSDYQLHLHDTQ